MRKVLSWLLVCCVALTAAGCSKKNVPTYEQLKGTMSGSAYTNEYFSMTAEMPADWYIYTDEDFQRLGNKEASTDIKNVDMFGSSLYSPDQETAFNTSVTCSAELISPMDSQNIKTGENYLREVSNQISASEMPYEIGETETITLGDQDFTLMPTTLTFDALVIHQDFYAAKINDYVIFLCASYVTDEDKVAAGELINSIKITKSTN